MQKNYDPTQATYLSQHALKRKDNNQFPWPYQARYAFELETSGNSAQKVSTLRARFQEKIVTCDLTRNSQQKMSQKRQAQKKITSNPKKPTSDMSSNCDFAFASWPVDHNTLPTIASPGSIKSIWWPQALARAYGKEKHMNYMSSCNDPTNVHWVQVVCLTKKIAPPYFQMPASALRHNEIRHIQSINFLHTPLP